MKKSGNMHDVPGLYCVAGHPALISLQITLLLESQLPSLSYDECSSLPALEQKRELPR